jgi:Fe-S cluster assembly scaffold protein SufB
MQQRGIGRQKARQLLIGAFMKEVIETISDRYSAVREQLLDSIDGVIE